MVNQMKIDTHGKKSYLITLISYFCISLIIYRIPLSVIDPCSTTISGDLVLPMSTENYIKQFYPLWNDHLSTSNWITISRLPLYYPFLPIIYIFQINPINFIEVLWVITETLAGMAVFFLSFYVLRKTHSKIGKNILTFASFISGFIYMFNPYILQLSHHITLKLGYSLFPLYILFLLLSFEENKLSYLVFSAFLLTLLSSTPHYTVFGLASLFFSTVFFSITEKRINCITIFFKIISLYILFSAYWLIPFILATIQGEELSPTYLLTKETVNMLSRNANLVNVFQFYTGWTVDKLFANPPIAILSPDILNVIRILVTFVSLFSLFHIRKNKYVIFFSLILLIFVPFAGGTKIFPELYYWLTFNFSFGWIFRAPEKLIVFIVLSISALLAFSFKDLAKNLQKKIIRPHLLLLAILVVLISVSNWPLLTGDFNGDLTPVTVPDSFFAVNHRISHSGDFKVLWMPKYWGKTSEWNKGHATSAFDEVISIKPTYQVTGPIKVYYFYVLGIYYGPYSVLAENRTENLGKYLSPCLLYTSPSPRD